MPGRDEEGEVDDELRSIFRELLEKRRISPGRYRITIPRMTADLIAEGETEIRSTADYLAFFDSFSIDTVRREAEDFVRDDFNI